MSGTLLANGINIVLNALFLLVFRWGVFGVALATGISRLFQLIWVFCASRRLVRPVPDAAPPGNGALLMKYPLVIFDLDGTILDTLEDLHASANAALRAFSMPERSLSEIRAFVGNGIRKLIELIVPSDTPAETIDSVQQFFSGHYKQHCSDRTRPYDGIAELICELRPLGCKTAVVSNKDDYAVRALCEMHFPGMFDVVVGSREGVRKKPAPDSVNEVLVQLGLNREEAVYIGDSEVDYETANNAGMKLLTVAWGFRDEDQLRKIGCTDISLTIKDLRSRLV
jgi:phosphoglycolate phosphatase